MTRILLLNPPSPPGTTINREGAGGLGNRYAEAGAFLYPPQTLATCAAVLRAAGAPPAFLDATAEGLTEAETLARVAGIAPEVVVALVSWSGWEEDVAFCGRLRRADGGPGAHPTAGGGAGARPAVILVGTILRQAEYAARATAVCDLALAGEPERALPAACAAVRRGPGAGRIASAAEFAPADYDVGGYLLDLEGLPTPAWDLAPLGRYRALTLLSARGCPAGCIYCPYVIGWGPRFRACSSRRTVDELEELARRFRPARLMFRDSVFAHDRRRVEGICEEILARRLSVSWECESRPEHFDAALLRLMRRAGCATIKVGLESAWPARLVALGRLESLPAADAYLARLREVAATCRQIGLRLHLFSMAGWPNATPEEARAGERFVGEIMPAHLTVKAAEAYPGTPWTVSGRRADVARAAREIERLSALARPLPAARRPLWRRAAGWIKRRLA